MCRDLLNYLMEAGLVKSTSLNYVKGLPDGPVEHFG